MQAFLESLKQPRSSCKGLIHWRNNFIKILLRPLWFATSTKLGKKHLQQIEHDIFQDIRNFFKYSFNLAQGLKRVSNLKEPKLATLFLKTLFLSRSALLSVCSTSSPFPQLLFPSNKYRTAHKQFVIGGNEFLIIETDNVLWHLEQCRWGMDY